MTAGDGMHTCPAKGCSRQVRNDKLFCFDHWRLVPSPLQSAVYAAYNAQNHEALSKTQWAAIKAVNEKLQAQS